MSLVAIITDTHYGARKGADYLHNYFEKFYSEVFFPTLKARGVKTILHLGDAFDSRKSIEYNSLQWTKRVVFDPMKDFDVHMVVGNHDCYFKSTNRTNSPDLLLQDYSNVSTYSEPTEIEVDGTKILMLPWICEDNVGKTRQMIQDTKANYAMGHLELSGFEAYRGHKFEDGKGLVSPTDFSKFDKVLSGHFHTRSDDGKIFYMGNPYEMYWNDVNDPRGFVLFDTETGEIEYVNNPNTLFSIIYYEDTKHQLFDATEYRDKIVKVVVRKKSKQKDFDKFLDKLFNIGLIDMKVVENFNVQETEDFNADDSEENTLSILNRYVDEADFEESFLEKNSIKELISKIYQEACEVQFMDDKYCYLLTIDDSEGTHIYSLRDSNRDPEVLLFEDEEDAERYAIMLEQDDGYLIGDSLNMNVAEVKFKSAIEILKTKQRSYILVKKEDLFIPPPY